MNIDHSKSEAYLVARAVDLDLARSEWVEIAPANHSRGIYKTRLGFDAWNGGKDSLADLITEHLWFPCRDAKGEPQSWVLRPFPVLIKNGQEVKFLNSKGKSFPWTPRATWAVCENIKHPLFVIEGVPKALALLTAGFHSISVAGVWMATQTREDGSICLQPVLERNFVLCGRVVYLAFDADYSINAKVRQAIIRTAILFCKAGAELKLLTWPISEGKGIDDYLAGKNSHGPEALKVLCEKASELSSIIQKCDLDIIETELTCAQLKSTRLAQLCRQLAPALKIPAATLRASVSSESEEKREFNLENPEPWQESVNGVTLIEEIPCLIEKHLVISAPKAHAVALWILLTYFESVVRCLPILIIRSPEKRCGKTTLLELLLALVSKPLPSANITVAGLYRIIERHGPTILADEVDTWLKEDPEARGIINSGHTRPFAFKILCNPNTLEPERFSTWAPKVFAGIGELADTIADRAIQILLERAPQGTAIPKLIDSDPKIFERMRRQLVRWSLDHSASIEESRPKLPPSLNHRESDNWFPLFQIANEIGGTWPARTQTAALLLSGQDDTATIGTKVLDALERIYNEDSDVPVETDGFLKSERIIEEINKDNEAPWDRPGLSETISTR